MLYVYPQEFGNDSQVVSLNSGCRIGVRDDLRLNDGHPTHLSRRARVKPAPDPVPGPGKFQSEFITFNES